MNFQINSFAARFLILSLSLSMFEISLVDFSGYDALNLNGNADKWTKHGSRMKQEPF